MPATSPAVWPWLLQPGELSVPPNRPSDIGMIISPHSSTGRLMLTFLPLDLLLRRLRALRRSRRRRRGDSRARTSRPAADAARPAPRREAPAAEATASSDFPAASAACARP